MQLICIILHVAASSQDLHPWKLLLKIPYYYRNFFFFSEFTKIVQVFLKYATVKEPRLRATRGNAVS